MTEISAGDCPICGQSIPVRSPGNRHGSPPKTCSDACRKERKRRIEKARYSTVKETPHWREVRADYLVKLKSRLEEDPEFAAIFRAEAAMRTKAWQQQIRESDPERHAQMKSEKRAERAAWRDRITADPNAWEAHKAKCRAWYSALSPEERERIYYGPRRTRQ